MKHSEILVKLRKIIRSVNLESKRIEKEHGISIPQLLCLSFLSEKDTFQASHKELKDFLQLNASTVTGIISRLERKGYVARLPKRNDKRIGLIIITASGFNLLEKTPEPLHDQLTIKLNQTSPEKLQKLQDCFDTIIDFLNLESVDAAPIITASTDISNSEGVQ